MKFFKPLCLATLAMTSCLWGGLTWGQDRVALIIGISEYAPEVRANSLAGVRHDMESARMIAQAMGVPTDKMAYLRDDQATKNNILQKLNQLGQDAPDGGRALIYFSGHGTRYFDREAGGCIEGLLTYDGLTITHGEFAQVTKPLSQKSDKVIALMDACHSGGVAGQANRTRAVLGGDRLSAKFHLKSGVEGDQCSMPSNMRTRGLVGEVTRLGGLQENFVQITSSLPDEVSFDEAGKGGLATQGLRDCLLGQAKDTDGSGAVTLEEVRQCAQAFIDRRLQNAVGLLPHHVTVRGNRNLIPIAVQTQTVLPQGSAPDATTAPVAALPAPVSGTSATANMATPSAAPVAVAAPAEAPANPLTSSIASGASTVAPPPQLASLATLQDILDQRDPRRQVDVTLSKKQLKIGHDPLQFQIKSSHPGHLYLVLLGSDAQSFYILFPNGVDQNNQLKAGQTVSLPRTHWQVQAAGPAGTDHILALVTDQPRDLGSLTRNRSDGSSPFTYTLNDLNGRADLIGFFVKPGAQGRVGSFGAAKVSVEEVP